MSGHYYTSEMKRWLGGYEPVIAAEMCLPRPGQVSREVKEARLRAAGPARNPHPVKKEKR